MIYINRTVSRNIIKFKNNYQIFVIINARKSIRITKYSDLNNFIVQYFVQYTLIYNLFTTIHIYKISILTMVATGETLQERTKGKDVRGSNIIAAKVSIV